MADLKEREKALLGRLSRSQKPMAIAGVVIALLGAAYLVWAVTRFDPFVDPRENPGFDWPVARLAFLFERGQFIVENAVPETAVEDRLLRRLARNMTFSSGVMVLLLRIAIGMLAVVMGFAMVTVVVERARLLAMIRSLRE